VDDFSVALGAIKELERDGVISAYAIGGAMALAFWSEPVATFDLDVFVLLQSSGPIVSLEPIYDWARRRGYPERGEHIFIADVPVQLIPAHNALAEEAIATAAELDYDGQPVRVIRPEYLIALALEPGARNRKRMARVAALLDEGNLDTRLLDDLLRRYKMELPPILRQ